MSSVQHQKWVAEGNINLASLDLEKWIVEKDVEWALSFVCYLITSVLSLCDVMSCFWPQVWREHHECFRSDSAGHCFILESCWLCSFPAKAQHIFTLWLGCQLLFPESSLPSIWLAQKHRMVGCRHKERNNKICYIFFWSLPFFDQRWRQEVKVCHTELFTDIHLSSKKTRHCLPWLGNLGPTLFCLVCCEIAWRGGKLVQGAQLWWLFCRVVSPRDRCDDVGKHAGRTFCWSTLCVAMAGSIPILSNMWQLDKNYWWRIQTCLWW